MSGAPTFGITIGTVGDDDTANPIVIGFFTGANAPDQYFEFIRKNEKDDIVWRFLQFLRDTYPGISIYSHNGADNEHKFLLNCLVKHREKLKFLGGTSKITWVDPSITFVDSYAVMGMGLGKVTRAMNVTRKSQVDTPVRDADLRMNCHALSESLGKFEDLLLQHFGVAPSATISLIAVKVLDKKFFPLKHIHPNEKHENFIRRATYAGRNEVFRRYGAGVNLYDIRGNYISCYDTPVPVGQMTWINPDISRGSIAEAIVHVPDDMFIGPLPVRINGRLFFPVGKLKGWWDTTELRFAEELGCVVEPIRQLCAEEFPALNTFAEYICRLRDQADYHDHNPDLGRLWKTMGLRLCGKFGQHRERSEICHILDLEDETGWYPIDTQEVYHERTAPMEGHRMPFVRTAVNMRIRAEARIRHLRHLLDADKKGQVFYCDTDSVYTTATLDVGNKHGDLQLQDWASRAYFIKCKTYGFIDRYGRTRQRTAGFKDVALTEKDFQSVLDEGKEVHFTWKSLPGWKTAMNAANVGEVDKARTLRDDFDGNRVICENGTDTRPLIVDMV